MTQNIMQPTSLLGIPPFPSQGYAALADRLKSLLATRSDLVFVQAEAIVALEAAAHSLGGPGRVALNIVTSPYGHYFGEWLRRSGTTVHDLVANDGRPIRLAAVNDALNNLPRVDLVAVVHAETSTGILNPLQAIAEISRKRKALLIVDAVASVGGHELAVDDLGIDLCVIGPQKALGGPAGVSMVTISPNAWEMMASLSKPTPSVLNLLDLKTNWLDSGRSILPGMPSAIEFWALDAALQRIEQETLPATIARHCLTARAARAGLQALGLLTWITNDREASSLVTTFTIAGALNHKNLLDLAISSGVAVSASHGTFGSRLLRLDHTGPRANFSPALGNIVGLGQILNTLGASANIGAATEAFVRVYQAPNA